MMRAKRYDLGRILDIALKVRDNNGFWISGLFASRAARHAAQTCSDLFADAHARLTGRTLGEIGICVPAHLSQRAELLDVPLQWARIVDK